MSFERELLKRIPRYEADGLIDRAAAEKLSAHLRASLEGKKPIFFNAVYFAGAILLIVSSCLFVQNIWDELSAGMRLLLAFVPLVISTTFGVCALLLRLHPLLREAAAAANILAAGAMLCLIAAILNLEGNFRDFSVAMISFALPLVFIFNSRAAAGIAAIWCAVLANPYSRDAGVFDALFTCACFAAVGIHAFRNRAEPNALNAVLRLIICICAPILAGDALEILVVGMCPPVGSEALSDIDHFYAAVSVGIGAAMLAVGAKSGDFRVLKVPHLFVGLLIMCGAMCVLNAPNSYVGEHAILLYSLPPLADLFGLSAAAGCILVGALALAVLAWGVATFRALASAERLTGAALAGFIFPLYAAAGLFCGNRYIPFMILSNAVFFAAAASLAFAGVRRGSFLLLNAGVAMIVWQGILRVSASDGGILFRSAFFGLCGILLIGANYFLKRRLDREN